MISLVQNTVQTLEKNSMQASTYKTGLLICLVQEAAQTLVEEELNVDQKDWVDDLLGVGYCVDSTGERTRCRPEGLG